MAAPTKAARKMPKARSWLPISSRLTDSMTFKATARSRIAPDRARIPRVMPVKSLAIPLFARIAAIAATITKPAITSSKEFVAVFNLSESVCASRYSDPARIAIASAMLIIGFD